MTRVFLAGAGGFIGRHVQAALEQAGFEVLRGISRQRYARMDDAQRRGSIPMDFVQDGVDAWRARLAQYQPEVVINAIGALRSTRQRPLEAIHHSGPAALFDACAQGNAGPASGVRRVVQISALGVEGSQTLYASTKRAADAHLLALAQSAPLRAVVLRPSVVFGRGGASSALFMNLARLPLLCLPRPVLRARVQLLAIPDLAEAVARLADPDHAQDGILECTGPEPVRYGDLIASLRQQCGQRPARVLGLPDWLTQLSARAGDRVPASPWCRESLALLGTDNVAPPDALRQLLGREAIHYSRLVADVWSKP